MGGDWAMEERERGNERLERAPQWFKSNTIAGRRKKAKGEMEGESSEWIERKLVGILSSRRIGADELSEDEQRVLLEISRRLSELEEIEEELGDGRLLRQGDLPGTYNGHICPTCSSREAEWGCTGCLGFYCIDHYDHDPRICHDCRREEGDGAGSTGKGGGMGSGRGPASSS